MEFLLKYKGEPLKIYDDGGLNNSLGVNVIGMNGSEARSAMLNSGYSVDIEHLGFGIPAAILKIKGE